MEKISSFLSNENAYDLLAECIIHPSRKIIMTNNNDIDNNNDTVVIQTKDEHLHIKRSYRAMILLVNDAMKASNIRRDQGKTFDHSDDSIFKDLILDNTRAGLLTKKIFAAYKRCIEQDGINNSMDEEEEETFNHCPSELSLLPHIPHLNKLLQALIDGFPSAVIGASCVGGKSGIDISLKPMLSLQQIPESASPYPTFTQIVTRGCTGRLCGEQQQPISMQQQQQQYPSMGNINQTFISKGHRRKFVRSLSEWGLLTFLIHKITNDSSTTNIPTTVDEWNNNNHDISFDAEIACDALITIVESVCYPPLNNNKEKKQMLDESVGEEALLSPLASDELVQQLAGCAMDVHSPFAVTASRALLQLFELATGRSKKSQPPPAIDATEEDIVDDSNRSSSSSSTSSSTTTTTEKTTIPPEKNNKLLKSGLTTTMHTKLISNITLLIEGLCIHHHHQQQQEEEINTTKEYSNHVISEPVSHPGGYIIEHPFTSRRLNLITLLADILNYEDHEVMNGSVKRTSINGQLCYTSSCTALDTIMKLPMFSPPVVDGGTTTTTSSNNNDDSTVIYNPWPTLCDLVFAYPENNLYQIQFYRLLHALCMTNHEASLKMVVQKSKFVSRAISTCKDSNCTSLYGVLLRCLNALRLHSQSLSPRSFLRNYLDSHDGWKDFQTDLRRYVHTYMEKTTLSIFFHYYYYNYFVSWIIIKVISYIVTYNCCIFFKKNDNGTTITRWWYSCTKYYYNYYYYCCSY